MKLLILAVPSGGGHTQAAKALKEAGQHFPQLDIKYINALDYASRAARLTYQNAYLSLVKHSPALWGFIFNQSDNLHAKKILNLTRRLQAVNARALINFIKKWRPDAIVSTHFFDNFVLHDQFKNGELTCPWYTVITDFYAHHLWLNEFCAQYFVAAPEVRDQLIALSVPTNKVAVTGIPLRQQFLEKFDKAAVLKKYELDQNLPVILVLGGGFGLGDLEKTVKILADLPLAAQIIAVAGDNKNLEKKLKALSLAFSSRAPHQNKVRYGVDSARDLHRSRIIALGLVKNMAELMAVATLAVTKAGAVTISECLAMALPIVIPSPTPGQEKANCDYLLKYNAAKMAFSHPERKPKSRVRLFGWNEGIPSLAEQVLELLTNKNELRTLAAATKKIARPKAAADILKRVTSNP